MSFFIDLYISFTSGKLLNLSLSLSLPLSLPPSLPLSLCRSERDVEGEREQRRREGEEMEAMLADLTRQLDEAVRRRQNTEEAIKQLEKQRDQHRSDSLN